MFGLKGRKKEKKKESRKRNSRVCKSDFSLGWCDINGSGEGGGRPGAQAGREKGRKYGARHRERMRKPIWQCKGLMQGNNTAGLPWWLSGKECQCKRCRRRRFDPWVGKIPWKRKWQPTPVFLPGKSHEQRSLAGYSPWGHRELDMT